VFCFRLYRHKHCFRFCLFGTHNIFIFFCVHRFSLHMHHNLSRRVTKISPIWLSPFAKVELAKFGNDTQEKKNLYCFCNLCILFSFVLPSGAKVVITKILLYQRLDCADKNYLFFVVFSLLFFFPSVLGSIRDLQFVIRVCTVVWNISTGNSYHHTGIFINTFLFLNTAVIHHNSRIHSIIVLSSSLCVRFLLSTLIFRLRLLF
jgi:hypothetical protein